VFRQGPNQYFFTLDSYTVKELEVVRGSASTEYGSDALGGAILAYPREPRLLAEDELVAHSSLLGRFASADLERGGRAELELSLWRDTALLAGGGYREAERLESGGLVRNAGQPIPRVPRFEADGRTMLGTGFREATFDARIVRRLRASLRLIGALYGYRQYDAPRTDQCPPPEAPVSECLSIEEQFRTLGYLALRGSAGTALHDFDLHASFQRHDELRVNDRPRSFVRASYDNEVSTLEVALRARTRAFALGPGSSYKLLYGLDAQRDGVASRAASRLTDPELEAIFAPDELLTVLSRGQYLDGSSYASAGAFAEIELAPLDWLDVRAGGRASAVGANAPSEPVSGSRAVSERWLAAVGRAGATAQVVRDVSVSLNFDQGFRAPNLDDLSSRQQVGPGFQLENPTLAPERTNTLELGMQAEPGPVTLQAWTFVTWLDDAITRVLREQDDCPPETEACRASRVRYQLVNGPGTARILGAEGMLSVSPFRGALLRATTAYAHGQGPAPAEQAARGEVPLSRIPPWNGTLEARYEHEPIGLYGGAALRWALAQRRLAPSDETDPRIPDGGTPGYAVLDLRAGYRYSAHLRLHLMLENLLDAAYRVHGSSINGPGRGVVVGAAIGY
jgi:iron complex outermembrane receptor protein/hemoglobin/transferrin/lactoferrin receptor protein